MQDFFRKYGVALILLFLAVVAFSHYSKIGPENQVIRADGKGYYAYLPAIFVYHDNQMNFLYYYEGKYDFPVDFAEFRQKQYGRFVDKYYAGLAVLQVPFFLAAHIVSKVWGLPSDGYAPLYQQFFILGSLFYLFIGMQAFMFYLIALKIKPLYAWMSVLFILLGTNCYHYTVYEQCMTHIFNLGMMCVFIYGMHNVFHGRSSKWVVISFIALGLIFILRPVNIIVVLFVPFVAGSWTTLKSGIAFIFKKPYHLLIGVIGFLVPVIIQCSLWYWQTGHIYVYAYGKEVMEWTNPKIYHILFSYRSGWFLWSPMALIGILGLLFYFKERFRFFAALLFAFLFIYVISCWWTPDYGWRFGSRVFIDFLFLPGIGLALALQKIKKGYIRIAFVLVCFIGLFVNQVQAYQYRKQIITWDGMGRYSYWRVFLQTGRAYEHWLDEKNNFKPQVIIEKNIDKSFFDGFETMGTWAGDGNVTDKIARTGLFSYVIDRDHTFSPAFKYSMTSDALKNDSVVQESVWFYGPQPEDTRLVVKFERNGKQLFWNDFMFRGYVIENHTWTRAILHVPIPKEILPGDNLVCFVYNGDSKIRFFLDDFRVDFIKK